MRLIVNGETRDVDADEGGDGLTVHAFLETLGLNPRKVAVERNLEIVPRSTFEETRLADGDRLEIVHFIGGGTA